MTEKQFYRPDEIAKMLRFAKSTIYRWIRTGKIRAIKMGASYRVPDDVLKNKIEPTDSNG